MAFAPSSLHSSLTMSQIKVARYRPSHYLLPIGIDTVTTLFVSECIKEIVTIVLVFFAVVRETISFPFSTLGASALIHVPPICRIAIFSSLPFVPYFDPSLAPIWSLPIPISSNLLQVSSSSTDRLILPPPTGAKYSQGFPV